MCKFGAPAGIRTRVRGFLSLLRREAAILDRTILPEPPQFKTKMFSSFKLWFLKRKNEDKVYQKNGVFNILRFRQVFFQGLSLLLVWLLLSHRLYAESLKKILLRILLLAP